MDDKTRDQLTALFRKAGKASLLPEGMKECEDRGIPLQKNGIEAVPGKIEEGSILVCLPVDGALVVDDNKTAPCQLCGIVIQYRPYTPENLQKVCVNCAFTMAQADENRRN